MVLVVYHKVIDHVQLFTLLCRPSRVTQQECKCAILFLFHTAYLPNVCFV